MDLYALTLVSLIAISYGQPAGHSGHGFDIQGLTQGSFAVLDISPQDGTLSENEWKAMLDLYNSNGDNCTTVAEYSSHTGMPEFVAKLVYGELGTDNDACLTAIEMAEKRLNLRDNCTTVAEYSSHTGMPEFVAKLVYGELDTNNDACLTTIEMAEKFRHLDTDGNGEVSQQEYGNYYQKVFASMFSHMGHGSGGQGH